MPNKQNTKQCSSNTTKTTKSFRKNKTKTCTIFSKDQSNICKACTICFCMWSRGHHFCFEKTLRTSIQRNRVRGVSKGARCSSTPSCARQSEYMSQSVQTKWQAHKFEDATFTGAVRGHASSSSVAVAGNGQLILARGGYPRFVLLKASRADALITPEHCVLTLHRDREVHAAQFQHHVMPRYWATECEGCKVFHLIGMYAPARTCCTPSPREFPLHGLNFACQRTNDVSPMLCLRI